MGRFNRARQPSLLLSLAALGLLTAIPVFALTVSVSVDTSLADYIVEIACSGEQIDEQRLRDSPLLQAQIKHHSGNAEQYTMDAFIEAAKSAAACKVPEPDLYRVRYVVEDRETIAAAVSFLKSHEHELATYVEEKTAPYFPADKTFTGEVVIVAASWSCGGFSMDGAFFIDVPCVAGSIEDEFEAVKVLSAHETYHALQYAFFSPFVEDLELIQTSDQALAYLFLNLLLEGTAEFVADSRDVPGEGQLASIFRRFAASGYRQLDDNFRWLDYAAGILKVDDATNTRIRDVYAFGFSGSNDQKFYYVGATMARQIEAVFGRQALLCIMALSPEQFVLAYNDAHGREDEPLGYPIGTSALEEARRLGKDHHSYETCR